MKVLRDASLSSRLLILLELKRRRVGTLAPLAEGVGLTPQAVSQYIKKLEREGLVAREDGIYRATPAGEEFLRSHLFELKEWTDAAVRELVVIRSCVAIARGAVRAGDRVGLFMEGGRLVAHPGRRSPSSGTAMGDAPAGSDVLVTDLEGVVEIPAASLHIFEAPSPDEGGSSAVESGWLEGAAGDLDAARWAALDEVGEALLKQAGKVASMEFAPFESAVRAVERGVEVAYLGSREAVGRLVSRIEAAKAEGKLRGFTYQVTRARRLARKDTKGRRKGQP